MIAEGQYKAKIADYSVALNQYKQPYPVVWFHVPSEKTMVKWQGTFKEGRGREICFEALAVCGLSHPSKIQALAEGPHGGALDMSRDLFVTVEHETYNNKTQAKIKWINAKEGMKPKDAVNKSDFAMLMSDMGLEASFLEIAQKNGVEVKEQTYAAPKEEEKDIYKDIPF